MIERRHLQPINATRYERAISETMDRSPELDPVITAIRGFKFDPSDRILPYLIAEYGLTEIADYLPDLRAALAEGILWQRSRGTPSAMHRALAWVGADGTIEENPAWRFKWWWFQVHLPDERRSSAFARPMAAVANVSKPLCSEFARVTAGYDKRGFNLNAHRLNGGALLNSWSGVRKAAAGPVLSLRYHHRVTTDLGIDVGQAERTSLMRVWLLDASAPTIQRSSSGVSYATEPVRYEDGTPFQHAPFTDDVFGLPVPRIQTGY